MLTLLCLVRSNYPCDSRIELYFGKETSLDDVGTGPFQRQLYECMLAKLLWLKGRLEMMRAGNSFGALVWQLNENWPTGGWGCLEYGPGRGAKGQVVGGRWKPTMYLLRRLFHDTIVTCGVGGLCFVRDDGLNVTYVETRAEAWSLEQQLPLRTFNWNCTTEQGRSIAWFHLPDGFQDDADVILLQSLHGSSGTGAFLWNVPRDMHRLSVPVTFSVVVEPLSTSRSAYVRLTSDRLALYVVLSTAADGQFSDNAFHMRPGAPFTIIFDTVPSDQSLDLDLFLRTLHLEHLGRTRQIMLNTAGNTATTVSST